MIMLYAWPNNLFSWKDEITFKICHFQSFSITFNTTSTKDNLSTKKKFIYSYFGCPLISYVMIISIIEITHILIHIIETESTWYDINVNVYILIDNGRTWGAVKLSG